MKHQWKKPDWQLVALILALGAGVVWVAIVLGKSSFGWMIP